MSKRSFKIKELKNNKAEEQNEELNFPYSHRYNDYVVNEIVNQMVVNGIGTIIFDDLDVHDVRYPLFFTVYMNFNGFYYPEPNTILIKMPLFKFLKMKYKNKYFFKHFNIKRLTKKIDNRIPIRNINEVYDIIINNLNKYEDIPDEVWPHLISDTMFRYYVK